MDVAHNLPKPSQWVLRRLETPVSVDAAPTFFLGLTTGSDKAGVFCPHGRILIFPQVYTGGHEEVSVLLCPCGPKSSRSVTEGSEEAGAPVTMNAAPPSRSLNLCPEGSGSSCQSGRGTTSS